MAFWDQGKKLHCLHFFLNQLCVSLYTQLVNRLHSQDDIESGVDPGEIKMNSSCWKNDRTSITRRTVCPDVIAGTRAQQLSKQPSLEAPGGNFISQFSVQDGNLVGTMEGNTLNTTTGKLQVVIHCSFCQDRCLKKPYR